EEHGRGRQQVLPEERPVETRSRDHVISLWWCASVRRRPGGAYWEMSSPVRFHFVRIELYAPFFWTAASASARAPCRAWASLRVAMPTVIRLNGSPANRKASGCWPITYAAVSRVVP